MRGWPVGCCTGIGGGKNILDPVGASHWEQNFRSIRAGGRWVVIGGLGGQTVERFNLGAFLGKRIRLQFSTLRPLPVQDKIRLTEQFVRFAWHRFDSGALAPVVDRIYPWTEAEEAHAYMKSNRSIGKIVLRVGD